MADQSFTPPELGDPISFEDVISIMTVIFVLFFLFMVPIVNIEKVRTELVEKDTYWVTLREWLSGNEKPSPLQKQYAAALEFYGQNVLISEPGKNQRYLEFVSPNGDVSVTLHSLKSGKYINMVVQENGGVFLYRTGIFKWSARDGEWFTDRNQVIYGDDKRAKEMLINYRKWTKKQRGF